MFESNCSTVIKIANFKGSCAGKFIPGGTPEEPGHFVGGDEEGGQNEATEAFNKWMEEKPRDIIGVNFGFHKVDREDHHFVITVMYSEPKPDVSESMPPSIPKVIEFVGSCSGEAYPSQAAAVDCGPTHSRSDEAGIKKAVEQFDVWEREKVRDIISITHGFRIRNHGDQNPDFFVSVLYRG